MKAPFLLAASLAAVAATAAARPVLPSIRPAIEKHMEAREITGAVTAVGNRDALLHLEATGQADPAENRSMEEDAIFWVASMTKPVTATAVMMMQEAGKLSLDDPLSKHLPEFADLKDAEGNPVSVTLRECLAHTSGLAEASPDEASSAETLAELMPLVAAKPVQFAPGSRWQYCQSSINAAARVVEVVSGESFPEFLEKRIFRPLGMKDTTFYLSQGQLPRLAPSFERTEDGQLRKTGIRFLAGKSPDSRDRYPLANGGLFSTAADFSRFARMILRGGELDGARILNTASVEEMTAVQTGALQTGFTPGNAWGVGWCLIREPQGPSAALSSGSFGHGGAYGTQMWIDPAKGRFFLLLVQRSNFPNSDASDLRRDFQDAAAAAVEGD